MSNVRKAFVPVVLGVAAVLAQLLATGEFSVDAELVTTVFAAVTALVVYLVPNLNAPGLAGVRKALVPLGTALIAVVVQLLNTGHFSDSQELVTAVTGVLTALFVYWVPNARQVLTARRDSV
jgi:phosphatidylserine synthase